MDSQQKADANISLQLVKLAAVSVVLALFGWGATYLEDDFQEVDNHAFKQEFLRLQQVVGSIHSQWTIRGKPSTINLSWQDLATLTLPLADNPVVATTQVKLSSQGFPVPMFNSRQGCESLWHTLMGANKHKLKLIILFNHKQQQCEYKVPSGGAIFYQLSHETLTFVDK